MSGAKGAVEGGWNGLPDLVEALGDLQAMVGA